MKKDYLEEHSKEKIKFYEKYLNAYLAILLNWHYTKAINIYDVFCGVGLYSDDGSKGSLKARICFKKYIMILLIKRV